MKPRVCSKCGVIRKDDNFNKGQSYCKSCNNDYGNKWRSENKGNRRMHHLKDKYDITVEEYNDMFLEQHGLCAICGNPERSKTKAGKLKWLVVDHRHDTGEVRGLLCNSCNTGIGLLGDSVSNLQSAIKYLKKRGQYGK